MNWKTILHLVRVDMKSGRLTRGQKLIKYNVTRNRFFSYLGYLAAIIIGVVVGGLVSYFYTSGFDATLQSDFNAVFANFQLSLPTIVLVFALIFTMMQQLQRTGASSVNQAPYWLPVTWQEHTLASILADLLGLPLMTIALIAPAVLIVSVFTGQIIFAVGSVLAMFAAAFTAGATIEVFRILQVRFTGAVYKSTGRAAVWVRFVSSIVVFIIFYVIYFSITQGSGLLIFIDTVTTIQNSAWFVPYVWLGLTLYSLGNGLMLEGVAFLVLSVLFILGLFFLGTALNSRFGLYEPPAITISRGAYVPKTGFLGKFGFSSVEAALIRKDLKAFTRRRELISTFIVPIVFLLVPIMSSINNPQSSTIPGGLSSFMFALTSIFPAGLMVMSLGNFMTGEEGQNIWRIYSSPISAKNFVKSKFAFILFFSFIVLPITVTIGFFIYQPSMRALIAMVAEAVFIVFAAGSLSLANGIKGADFNEVPRPRMIRSEWSIINMLTCMAVALAVLLPMLPYAFSVFTGGQIGVIIDLYLALAISGVIAAVLTVIFYNLAVGNAKELLTKAEV
jgi:hypothetical protein